MAVDGTTKRLCGVFKGGGAKGVAYAGALRAFEDEDDCFDAVAGASAGAITAALIAAGLTSAEITSQMSDALAGVKFAPFSAIGRGTSLYKVTRLRTWMDDVLRRQVGEGDPRRRITFRQLYDAKPVRRGDSQCAIELFVVAMNLHTKVPIVFNEGLTPDLSVTDAVLASCAIPGALPNGRLVSEEQPGDYRVDALVDGGAYANFPEFVFCDESFRLWYWTERHRLSGEQQRTDSVLADGTSRLVFGFVLNDRLHHEQPTATGFIEDPVHLSAYDRGTSKTSGTTAQWVLSEFFGGNIARFTAAILTTIVLIITSQRLADVYQWANIEAQDRLDFPGGRRVAPLLAFALPAALFGVVLALTLVMLAAVLAGRTFSTVVVPAGIAALGTSTGVAPWLGSVAARAAAPSETADPATSLMWKLIVIEVPTSGIRTLDFRLDPQKRNDAVDIARQCVGYQLALRRSRPFMDSAFEPTARSERRSRRLSSMGRATVVIVQAASAGVLFFIALELLHVADGRQQLLERVGAALLALLTGLLSLGVLGMLTGMGAYRSAERADRVTNGGRKLLLVIVATFGALAIGVAWFLGGRLDQFARRDYDLAVVEEVRMSTNGVMIESVRFLDDSGENTRGPDGINAAANDFEVDPRERVSVRLPISNDTTEASPAFGREDRFTRPYVYQRVGLLCALVGVGSGLFLFKELELRAHRKKAGEASARGKLSASLTPSRGRERAPVPDPLRLRPS